MKAWTRRLSIALLFVACACLQLRAADDDGPAVPQEFKLKLYQIEASHTGKPECAEPLAFIKDILLKSFPQFDTFKLLFSPEQSLTAKAPSTFATGDFTTQITLLGFVKGAHEDGKPFWKAKLQVSCTQVKKVIHNLTIQILPGGQHIWAFDKIIFVLHWPSEETEP